MRASPSFLSSRRAGAALLLAPLMFAGCARDVGLGERCASLAQREFPQAQLHMAHIGVAISDRKALVDLDIVRTDAPANGQEPRDLAAECRYLDGVLTDFHWTTGPLR